MDRSAHLSTDEIYRYTPTRRWGPGPLLAWAMLNPSTADHERDDQTTRRCIAYSTAWGAGGLVIINRFALRATNPDELLHHPDPVGGRTNEAVVRQVLTDATACVLAWGAFIRKTNRRRITGTDIETIATRLRVPLLTLGRTRQGYPRHPARLGDDIVLVHAATGRPCHGGPR